jgi:CTP:molybdopterin cytidylyltransferase MocA
MAKDPSHKTNAVSGIILAAGRSERMGAFKPLLSFGPKTIIATCIDNLRDAGVDTVVVVIGQGPRAEALKDHVRNAGITFAVNPDPRSEMSDSIACGVRNLPEETKVVIINPVDHAAVPASVVNALLRKWEQGAKLVKPTWNDRGGHPVLVDLGFRDDLLHLDPAGGLKAFFHGHEDQVVRVPVDSNYIARDMDTWDDYRALHQEVFGVPPPEQIPAKTR